jgi:hypothetical protein
MGAYGGGCVGEEMVECHSRRKTTARTRTSTPPTQTPPDTWHLTD